jgi:hypothetical protein
MCVCVCVCAKEREGKGNERGEREREKVDLCNAGNAKILKEQILKPTPV